MIKKGFFIIIMIFLLVILSGCVQSHSTEFNNVNTLIESGTSRINPLISLNFDTVDLVAVTVNTSAAKENFSEARNILIKIPSKELSNKDQTNLNATIILIDANMKISDLLKSNLSDVIIEYWGSMNSPTNESSYLIDTSNMKKNLMLIKSDISAINISVNEKFNKLNNNDFSPSTLRIYNETENRLIIFNNNIDKTITYLENACLKKCSNGNVLGADCKCHPECGSGKYCNDGFVCCNEKCYSPCGFNSKRDIYCNCISRPTINLPPIYTVPSICLFDCSPTPTIPPYFIGMTLTPTQDPNCFRNCRIAGNPVFVCQDNCK